MQKSDQRLEIEKIGNSGPSDVCSTPLLWKKVVDGNYFKWAHLSPIYSFLRGENGLFTTKAIPTTFLVDPKMVDPYHT